MRAKFQLIVINALKDHGGEVTQERDLTSKEEQDLRLSWDLYSRFLAEDVETIGSLDKIYSHDKHSALTRPLRNGLAGELAMRHRCLADYTSTTTSGSYGPPPRKEALPAMTNTTGVWVLVHPERLGRCEL